MRMSATAPEPSIGGAADDACGPDAGSLLVGTWTPPSGRSGSTTTRLSPAVPSEEKDHLLRSYWSISLRQQQTCVVLVRGFHAFPGDVLKVDGLTTSAAAQPFARASCRPL